jgi:hypothetical protein
MRAEAERRLIVQATMQAKRAGKLPPREASSGSQALTAVVVVGAVIGILFLAFRYGG